MTPTATLALALTLTVSLTLTLTVPLTLTLTVTLGEAAEVLRSLLEGSTTTVDPATPALALT